MPLLTEIGLAPQSMDRQGGFASLHWTKGQNVGFGSKDDVRKLTTGYSGFWATYEVFRIESGTLLVTPEGTGCRGQLKMAYTALQRNFLTGYRWYALESNNALEQGLLSKIAEQIDTQILSQAQSNLKSPAITQPAGSIATVSIASNPGGADIELGGRFIGSTPSKVDLPTGKHEVVIKKAGHRDWSRKLDLLPGADINLHAELIPGEPMPLTSPSLQASSAVPQASATPTSEPPKAEPPQAIVVETAKVGFAPASMPSKIRIVCPDNVKEVPFSSSRPDRRKLACDEVITVVSESATWIRVKTADGLEGNVAARFVGK